MLQVHALTQSVTGLQQDVVQFLQWLKSQSYQFHTVSPDSHAAYLKRCKRTQAGHLRDIFGWSLPFKSTLLPDAIFRLLLSHQLVVQQGNLWTSLIRVSSLNDQLFVHSAYPTTQDNAVFFGPDTYRFIYALAQFLQCHQPVIHNALELCSGAAPAAVHLAHYAPQAQVLAADINELALDYSEINAAINQTPNLVVIKSNLFEQIDGQFDLITANPPYLVDPSERLYRHGGGLMGAELALHIVQQSLPRLNVQGSLLLYTGIVIVDGKDAFRQAVEQHLGSISSAFSLNYQQMDSDIFAEELNTVVYPEAERIAAVVLTIQRLS